MLRSSFVFCALAVLAFGPRAKGSTLYGSTAAGAPGELYILDPATGASLQDIGPLNDSGNNNYAVTGLAFHPVTHVLYGSTGGKSGTMLLTINPSNAQVTVVGSYNAGAGATMADIAFDSAGNLYGVSSAGGANLYSINITTGQATLVGASGFSITQGGGLSISPGGVFYTTPTTTEFGTFNPTTGAYTHITDPARPAGATASYSALAFDGNTLYGLNLGTPPHLVTLDASGNVTDLGTTPLQIDGIAFLSSISRPVLTVQLVANSISLTWPVAGSFRLLQNTNITSTNWIANTNQVNTANGTNQVTLSPAANKMFFRLVSP